MKDEAPQEQAPLQGVEQVERSTAGAIAEAAAIVGPLLPVAYEVGKDAWNAHQEAKPPEPPPIILPPGADKD